MGRYILVIIIAVVSLSCMDEDNIFRSRDMTNGKTEKQGNRKEESNSYTGEELRKIAELEIASKSGEMAARGYYAEDTLWEEKDISVCFQLEFTIQGETVTSDATDEDKAFARKLVEESWEKVTTLDFTGWGMCDGPGYDIYAWTDSRIPRGGTFAWGKNNKGHHIGFPTGSSRWAVNTVIHEFGHVLGLIHEHSRPDSECKKHGTTSGYTTYGDYDPNSVMHYRCEGTTPVLATELSPTDIETAIDMYGTYISGKFRGWNNRVFQFSLNNTVPVQLYKDGKYEIREEIFDVGDEYSLIVDSESPADTCQIRYQTGHVSYENAGNIDVNCYRTSELSAVVSTILL